ncbi:hypothetical protein Maq22A_c02935 [Methylobacterium aquaticum]|uniref:Uncharacterized protein n=1 Tax=Methylobacterium aquaticum TaxID=270351 RepID=A0A0C6FG50_9HYPH|nr:hypothetical protein Maq22A_c02935 [Methylobacterium aquaticum]
MAGALRVAPLDLREEERRDRLLLGVVHRRQAPRAEAWGVGRSGKAGNGIRTVLGYEAGRAPGRDEGSAVAQGLHRVEPGGAPGRV